MFTAPAAATPDLYVSVGLNTSSNEHQSSLAMRLHSTGFNIWFRQGALCTQTHNTAALTLAKVMFSGTSCAQRTEHVTEYVPASCMGLRLQKKIIAHRAGIMTVKHVRVPAHLVHSISSACEEKCMLIVLGSNLVIVRRPIGKQKHGSVEQSSCYYNVLVVCVGLSN